MNYYEILQVDKKASKEIIDKAFKVLAKKYHPDAHAEDKKEWAEQKFKELNNAYEVLSDDEKRMEYDATLEDEVSDVEIALVQKNKYLSNLVEELQNRLNEYENQNRNYNPFYTASYQQPYQTYQPPQPEPRVESHPYEPIRRDKHHSLKSFASLLITLFIIVIVFTALWFIPFTHHMLVNLYENNPIIKGIVDIFIHH